MNKKISRLTLAIATAIIILINFTKDEYYTDDYEAFNSDRAQQQSNRRGGFRYRLGLLGRSCEGSPMRRYLKILTSLVISLFLGISCGSEYIFTEVDEIINVSPQRDGYKHFGTHSMHFISPNVGFSSVRFKDEYNGKIDSFLRKTTDAGRSWDNCLQTIRPTEKIQSFGDNIYAFYAVNEIGEINIENDYSVILTSADRGESWHPLYRHRGIIEDFVVFDSLTMIIATEEPNNLSDSDLSRTHSSLYWLYITHDAGCSWSKLEDLSHVELPIFRAKNRIYFRTPRNNHVYTYNIESEELTKRYFNAQVYMFNISDNVMSMAWRGGDISFWEIKNNGEFDYFSNLKWGSFGGGSFHSKYLAKNEKYLFSYSSMFPGYDDINRALFFSDNNGQRWHELKLYNRDGRRPGDSSFNSYHNDTLFQIAYMTDDITTIFRVKK